MTEAERPRDIKTFPLVWEGITLEVTFERNWLSARNPITAHMTITVMSPAKAPLPITDTGYRSHFRPAHYVDDMGGPVAYVTAWLAAEATKPQWKRTELARRQPSLFD